MSLEEINNSFRSLESYETVLSCVGLITGVSILCIGLIYVYCHNSNQSSGLVTNKDKPI